MLYFSHGSRRGIPGGTAGAERRQAHAEEEAVRLGSLALGNGIALSGSSQSGGNEEGSEDGELHGDGGSRAWMTWTLKNNRSLR
jgi:hypothetical protein